MAGSHTQVWTNGNGVIQMLSNNTPIQALEHSALLLHQQPLALKGVDQGQASSTRCKGLSKTEGTSVTLHQHRTEICNSFAEKRADPDETGQPRHAVGTQNPFLARNQAQTSR